MKHLLLNLIIFLVASPVFAANTLHDKTEKASPTTSDEVYIWDITSSSLKKATAGNLPVSTPTQTEIDTKEDALGNPASDGYVLSSTAAGVRSWIEMSGGSMSWPASDSVYYGAYNGAWVALTEVFQSPLVAGTDYLTPAGAAEAYEGLLTCTTGQIKKWGASGWECDADDTGSGSVPDGTVDGQVLLWATDQWVASTFPGMLESGSYTPSGTWDWTSATGTWPTFNQNTTGSAATLTTPRTIAGTSFDGSANIDISFDNLTDQPTIPVASDTAYDATSWNGNTDVPTKNAVRDKIETLGSAFDPASPGAIGGTTPAAGTFTTVTAATYQSSAADGSRYSTLPNNTSAPSAATVANGFYAYNNAIYGVENSGTASLLLMANDIGVNVQAYDANMISWPSAIDATEVGYLDGLTEALLTTLSGKQTYDSDLDTWSGITPGTGVGTALGNALGSSGGVSTTIASGTAALGTSEISTGACATVVSSAGTNIATTDVIDWIFNADPSSTTGYNPSGDLLYIVAYPTAGYANFRVCNKSGNAITPGAVTLNWKVQR